MNSWKHYRTELLVALTVLVFVAPLAGRVGANERPRIALAAAIVDRGTVAITDYESSLTVDFAVRDGELYSDKAPGSSLLFVPIYATFRSITGSTALQAWAHVSYLFKLFMASIPAAVLAGLLTASLRKWLPPGSRAWASIMLVAGTMLLPFATQGFGHVLAALLTFSACVLVMSDQASSWSTLSAGALIGMGVMTEYPVVIVAFGLVTYLAAVSPKRLPSFVMGGAPFALGLGAYHSLAFDSVWATSYRYADSIRSDFSGVGLTRPDASDVISTLFSERGLVVLTPIVGVALVGLVLILWREQLLEPACGWLIAGIVVGLLLLTSMWIDDLAGPMGGNSPGPRFLIPSIPLLIWPLALMLRRWPVLTSVAGGMSILVMILATITDPLAPHDSGQPAISYWYGLISEVSLRPNVMNAFGSTGWAWHLGLVAAMSWMLFRATRRAEDRLAA